MARLVATASSIASVRYSTSYPSAVSFSTNGDAAATPTLSAAM